MKDLDTLRGLDALLIPSPDPRIIYKHSTQCGMCDTALSEIRTFEDEHPTAATIYYLDLWAHREVSDAVARKLGVRHESPQAILVKGGKVLAVLNHRAIRAEALEKAVRSASAS